METLPKCGLLVSVYSSGSIGRGVMGTGMNENGVGIEREREREREMLYCTQVLFL